MTYYKFAAIWPLVVCIVSLTCGASEKLTPPLPSGWVIPGQPAPDLPDPHSYAGRCNSCTSSQANLAIHDHDMVIHRVELDNYAPRWSSGLLTVEHGQKKHWRPESVCMFFPLGLSDRPDNAAIVLRRQLILFDKRVVSSETSLTSVNQASYSLKRSGDKMILDYNGQQRWVMESVDFGASWRLKRIEWPAFPTMVTRLEYQDGLVSELVYPNGASTRFQYENNSVSHVFLPNSHVYTIERDDFHQIAAISHYGATPDTKRRVQMSRRWVRDGGVARWVYEDPNAGLPEGEHLGSWRYENDAKGRITTLTSPCGDSQNIEYTTLETDGGTEHRVIVRSQSDGSYQFMRHRVSPGRWVIDRGTAEVDVPIEEGWISSRREYKKINGSWRAVRLTDHPGGFRQTLTYDQDGFVVEQTDGEGNKTTSKGHTKQRSTTYPDGKSRVVQKDESGRLVSRTEEDGSVTTHTYLSEDSVQVSSVSNDKYPQHTITFAYDDANRLSRIQQGTNVWSFTWDNLHRVESVTYPSGATDRYKWNDTDQLAEYTEMVPSADTLSTVKSVKYQYFANGNLKQSVYQDGSTESFEYTCNALAKHTNRNGTSTIYRYDTHGRLILRQTEGQVQERFSYGDGNFLTAYGQKHAAGWRVWRHQYDDSGARIVDILPNGQRVRYAYDGNGRMVSRQIGEQQARVFKYDERGRLVEEPPEE